MKNVNDNVNVNGNGKGRWSSQRHTRLRPRMVNGPRSATPSKREWAKFLGVLAVGCWLLGVSHVMAADGDSLRHWGYGLTLHPNWQIPLDKYVREWLQDKQAFAVGVEAVHSALPADSSAIDADFGYPTLAVGLRYGYNNSVTMHRDRFWGKARPVDYDSRLGNTLTLYGTFTRPLMRNRHWEVDYALGTGIGYNQLRYNKTDDIDNELIGSHFLIYFTAGLHLTWHPVPQWGLKAGVDFCHHSNGALARPNKGANSVGPSLSLVYTPYYTVAPRWQRPKMDKYSYLDFSVGIGGKTLIEDWQQTQFNTPEEDPDYRTEDFTFFMAYSLHAKWMYRYARRWASGIGADVFYGSYADHIKDLDERHNRQVAHSPWSVGLSANHTVYYHNMSLQVALGYYLYREMGHRAKKEEKPLYERVGLFYTFPSAGNLSIGLSLNALITKADFTEFVVSYPLRLNGK